MSITALLGYANARMEYERRDMTFRCYVSDALRVIGETLAYSLGGSYLSMRFIDMVHPREYGGRTGNEIVEEILNHIVFSGGEKV